MSSRKSKQHAGDNSIQFGEVFGDVIFNQPKKRPWLLYLVLVVFLALIGLAVVIWLLPSLIPEAVSSVELISAPQSASITIGQVSSTNNPDVEAELLELTRNENTVTVRVKIINSGETELSGISAFYVTHRTSYLLDEKTGKQYPLTISSVDNGHISVEGNSSNEFWAKYRVPEDETPASLTVVLKSGIMFEHVKVNSVS